MSGRVEMTIPPGCWNSAGLAISVDSDQRRDWNLRCRVARHRSASMLSATPASVYTSRFVGARQAERLADVTDRAARAVRRERRDECGVLLAVARTMSFSRMSRGTRSTSGNDLAVEEAPEREVVRDRIDVREAGEVTDERADRRSRAHAPAADAADRALARAPRARPRARARAPPSGAGGEAELADEVELLVEPLALVRLRFE